MSASPILGIDPGQGGGIALVGSDFHRAWKMPETERDLLDTIEDAKTMGVTTAYVEFVSSSPQMGVVSAFKFGAGYGGLRMAVIASGLRLETVVPSKWQRALGCSTGGGKQGERDGTRKNITKRKAQELFPSAKVTHAIADALLIAEYGRRVEASR